MKLQKKAIVLFATVILLAACQSGNNSESTTDENTPGPVSEADQSRYNMNAADEEIYGTTDTLKQDSLESVDSLRDSL